MNADIITSGRQLHMVHGRYLVWASQMDVQFLDKHKTRAIPLFFDLSQSGRFIIEAIGLLSFPESIEVRLFDTEKPYEEFHLPSSFTVASFGVPPIVITGGIQVQLYSYNTVEGQQITYNNYSANFSDGSSSVLYYRIPAGLNVADAQAFVSAQPKPSVGMSTTELDSIGYDIGGDR